MKTYENNEHLPMAIIMDEDEQPMGSSDCPAHYELQRIKVQFDIQTELWKMIPLESDGEDEHFDDLRCVHFDQQIENILQRYNQHSPSQTIAIDQIKSDHSTSLPIAIPEDDEQEKDTIDYDLHSLITNSRARATGVIPPPIAPRRSRQNSACSTQSSVRYAS